MILKDIFFGAYCLFAVSVLAFGIITILDIIRGR